MSENWKLQVSPKLADGTLINLRAETPEEFDLVVNWATENAAKFVNVVAAINAVPPALAGNVQSVQVQQEPFEQRAPEYAPQQNGGWGQPQQQAPQSGPPQLASAFETITDKWGVRWEYGRPDAPATPRGPAVAKHAVSQAGKAYSRWEDPAAGPKWFQERQPKVEKSQQWPGSFISTRG